MGYFLRALMQAAVSSDGGTFFACSRHWFFVDLGAFEKLILLRRFRERLGGTKGENIWEPGKRFTENVSFPFFDYALRAVFAIHA